MKQNLLLVLFLTLMLGIFTTNIWAQYSTTGPSFTGDSNVTNVTLVGETQTINYTPTAGVIDLELLTNLVADLNAGETYSVSVTWGTFGGVYNCAGSIWIDYDQSESFETAELIGSWSGTPTVTETYNFTVPPSATGGITRMRVMQQEGGVLPLDPDAAFSWGSKMDFGIQITPATGYPGIPTNPNPEHLATLVSLDTGISWTNGVDTDNVQVLFGTVNPPVTEVYNGLAVTSLTNTQIGGPLANSTIYYWRVVASNTTGSVNGPVWQFATEPPPGYTNFPYFEDFEDGPGNWTSGTVSGTNQWELGLPAQTNINSAYSGTNAWMTRLAVNYDNSSNCWLMSPPMDFTDLTTPMFSVWLNIWTENNWDGMILESSIDGGVTWTHVRADDTALEFYNNTSTSGPIAPPKWSGQIAGGWAQYVTLLPGLGGESSVFLRFRFGSDSSVNYEGIAVDDVRIWEPDNMLYVSSTTTQNNTSPTSTGAPNQEIIGVEIVTEDISDPLEVTSFTFSTNGSTNPADIVNAKVWYTGINSQFNTVNQFGDTYLSPDGIFVINGLQALSEGTNYFWLTYDIAVTATINNIVDATCNSITVDSIARTPDVTDPVGNRTILGAMGGTYVINHDGTGDYVSFNQAIDSLELLGIDSPVTFQVAPGTYTEQIIVSEYVGASATNTITFLGMGMTAEDVMLTYEATDTNLRYVVKLDGAKHIRFDNLKFAIGELATHGWVFHITNMSEDIEIKNSHLETVATATSTFYAGIIVSGSPTLATSAGDNVNGLMIENNTIVGGYYGLTLIGAAATPLQGGQVIGNTFLNSYYYGVYANNVESPIISHNVIDLRSEGTITTFGAGIYHLNGHGNLEFSYNEITNPGQYGMYVSGTNPVTDPSLIFNNSIGGGFRNTGTLASGIYILSSSNVGVYYNSIRNDSTTGRAMYTVATATNLSIMNNSFAFTGTGNGYAAYHASTASLAAHDYNNYYSGTSTNFVYYGADVANLAALQAVNVPVGNDTNSLQGDPMYTGQYNLEPFGPQLFAAGTPITGIEDDINGNLRDALTPCIGAYEFELGVDPELIVMPVSAHFVATTGGESLPIMFTLTNIGGGTLTILDGGITFSGVDADEFYLEMITYPIELDLGENIQIGVVFAPTSEGEKVANLQIVHNGDNSPYIVPITAFAYPVGTVIFGSGTEVNGTTAGNPINIYYRSLRGQMVYHASELLAAGIEPGSWLTNFGFFVAQSPLYAMPSFIIRMKHTTADDVAAHDDGPFELVYSNAAYLPDAGDWDVLELDEPFMWNGVDNILIDTAFGIVEPGYNSSGQSRIYQVPNGFRFVRADGADQTNVATTTVSTNKPQALMIFTDPPEITAIQGTVTLVGGTGVVTDVEVTAGGVTVNPEANGNYSLELFPGTYDVTASLMGYETQTISDVVLLEGIPTTGINFTLNNIQIAVNPTSFNETLEPGQMVTLPLTINNNGTGNLEFDLSVEYMEDLRSQFNYPQRARVGNQIRAHDSSFSERAPVSNVRVPSHQDFTRDLFDLLYFFEPEDAGGEYGVATDGNYIYTARWNTATIFRYQLDGTYVGSFTIPGFAGNLRDLTYDGQYFYGSPNTGVIYQVDLANETLIGQITTSVTNIRGIAYDAVNDGFWVTQAWGGPLRLISRAGVTLQTLTTTAASMSGLGWDGVTDGGPYLWAYTQPGAEGSNNRNTLVQINLTNGSVIQTFNLVPLGIFGFDTISGGMDITNQLVPGVWTFLGTAQNDVIWVLELMQDNIPWLTLDPMSGTIPAGQSVIIDVTFDTSELGLGTYEADIVIANNAQPEPIIVPVVLIVDSDMSPNPTVAHSPIPADGATNVSLSTEIGWTYTSDPSYTDPIGFKINMWEGDTSGDPYEAYIQGGPGEYSFDQHPFIFEYETEYFWQVIPTTETETRSSVARNRAAQRTNLTRGDAENCPIWSFTTLTEPTVLPPTNLTATLSGDDVMLNWEAPEFGEWFHWDDGINNDAIGTGAAATFKVAARFTHDNLVDFGVAGYYLSQVRFFPYEANCTYAINVWTGGSAAAPGTLVVNQPVTAPQINAWNTVELDNPVLIEVGQELWIGYDINTQGGYPAGCDAGPAVEGFGNMIYFNNVWSTLTALNPALIYNWNIHGFATNVLTRETVAFGNAQRSDYSPDTHQNYFVDGELGLSQISQSIAAPMYSRQGLTGFRVYRDGVSIGETDDDVTEYLDEGLEPGLYEYYVTALYDDLESEPSNIVEVEIVVSAGEETTTPFVTTLRSNYPNPFNPETTIAFDLQQPGRVTIEIFNIKGQKVATVIDDYLETGTHRVIWNGKTDRNRDAGSGIYFYRMQSGDYSATKKMILMK